MDRSNWHSSHQVVIFNNSETLNPFSFRHSNSVRNIQFYTRLLSCLRRTSHFNRWLTNAQTPKCPKPGLSVHLINAFAQHLRTELSSFDSMVLFFLDDRQHQSSSNRTFPTSMAWVSSPENSCSALRPWRRRTTPQRK